MIRNISLNPLGFKHNSFLSHFIASTNFSLVIGTFSLPRRMIPISSMQGELKSRVLPEFQIFRIPEGVSLGKHLILVHNRLPSILSIQLQVGKLNSYWDTSCNEKRNSSSHDPPNVHGSCSTVLTLCDPMGCSLPGSSFHGILHAGILEWVATSFSKGSS